MKRRTLLVAAPLAIASNGPARLLEIRRVHVDRLTGGEPAAHMRDMIIASLHRTGLFALTEDATKADAILRGSAEDLIFTDHFSSSDSISGRASVSDRGAGRSDRGSRSLSAGVGQNESVRIDERKHEATASVYLATRDGDIIWSTTQESLGAKFRGASADVAEKITRQLKADLERARLKR